MTGSDRDDAPNLQHDDRGSDSSGLGFDGRGLVPVVVQDSRSREVLMLAYANEEALSLTLRTGQAHYYSRSRQELWRKGATSGNTQRVTRVDLDCDGDAVLYHVEQEGPACHTGERSCFFRRLEGDGAIRRTGDSGGGDGTGGSGVGEVFEMLQSVVAQRLAELPEGSYVARLRELGLGYMAQKVVEEAGETVVAALEDRDDELLAESADLLFHLTVLLSHKGQDLAGVAAVLEARHRGS